MSRIHTPLTDELTDYIRQVALREPEALRRQREATDLHPRASMQTSPEQGQFLHLLARLAGAKKTLEVGVFLGYSSTWVALALPAGGKIVACDQSEEYTAAGAPTLARGRGGRQNRIAPRSGPGYAGRADRRRERQAALTSPSSMPTKATMRTITIAPWLLVRPGGLIAIDNVLWDGDVIDPAKTDAETEAIRAFNRKLQADERVTLSLVPLGDGLTLACKL